MPTAWADPFCNYCTNCEPTIFIQALKSEKGFRTGWCTMRTIGSTVHDGEPPKHILWACLLQANWTVVPRIGDDDSKESSKHQHEGTMIKKYSAWKGVATTVRVRLLQTSSCAEIYNCVRSFSWFLLQQDRVRPWVLWDCEGCSLVSQSYFYF